MSLYQSLEIDSLRVRNILTRTNNNSLIPQNFTLYSKGDGTTYWSSSVTVNQVTGLSTAVNSLASTVIGIQEALNSGGVGASDESPCGNYCSNTGITSSAVEYTDLAIRQYSTSAAILYTPLKSTYIISTSINRAIISTAIATEEYATELSDLIVSSFLYTSTTTSTLFKLYEKQSTFASARLDTLRSADSTVMGSSILYINRVVGLVYNNLRELATDVEVGFAITNTYPTLVANTASGLSTAIGVGDNRTLSLANAFTNLNLSTAAQTVSTTFGTNQITNTAIAASTTAGIMSSIGSTNLYVLGAVAVVSTAVAVKISTQNYNISTLLTTGLVDTLYQSFVDLEQYSYNIIASTLEISNNVLLSTSVTYEYVFMSTLEYINVSTFDYLVATAYLSSVDTVVPQVLSTIDYYISTEVVYFNSTVQGEIFYFNSSLSTFLTRTGDNVSTFIAEGLSEQSAIFSSTAELISTFDATANVSSLLNFKTLMENQYRTAPSIILNSVDHLSSIAGVGGITDISPVIVGIAELDVSQFNNFYILISDIRSDVYYGIVYTGGTAVVNRNINVTVDVQSSYSNRFQTLNTGTLAHWLSTPPIYNPVSYSLITATPRVPPAETVPQLYISSFLGTYNLNFRLSEQALLLQTVETYAYRYSRLSFAGPPLLAPANVQVLIPNSFSAGTSFRYRGTQMTLSWNTNDYNVPVGVNFLGLDTYGNTVSTWVGPFKASDLTATFTIPTQETGPYVTYRSMALSVYPENNQRTIATPFAEQSLDPLVLVNPSLNSRIKVYNATANPRYLSVAEIYLYNDLKQNVISDPRYASYRNLVSTSSGPYNLDPIKGPQSAMDNNPATAFWGGQDQAVIDTSAYVQAQLNALVPNYTSTTLISSIVLLPDIAFTTSGLYDMYLTLSNHNEPGVQNGLFYSTIRLPSSSVCAYSFNG